MKIEKENAILNAKLTGNTKDFKYTDSVGANKNLAVSIIRNVISKKESKVFILSKNIMDGARKIKFSTDTIYKIISEFKDSKCIIMCNINHMVDGLKDDMENRAYGGHGDSGKQLINHAIGGFLIDMLYLEKEIHVRITSTIMMGNQSMCMVNDAEHIIIHEDGRLEKKAGHLEDNRAFAVWALQMLVFINYAKIENKILSTKTTNSLKSGGVNYKTGHKYPIHVIDSTWYTSLIMSAGFDVSGHFRFQAKGQGLTLRELIWINPFKKTGYTRKANKLKEGYTKEMTELFEDEETNQHEQHTERT